MSRPAHAAPPRSRRRRVLVVTAAVLAGVLVVAAGAFALVVRQLEGNVERAEVFSGLDEDERPQAAGTAEGLTILVLGSDDRENDPIGQSIADEPGGYHAGGQRADTTLLVRLPPARDSAWVISIPRDSWVTLPPCTATDGRQLPEREGQFNMAFRDGGLTCTVRTVEALTDVRVDHTVVVDFSGFTDMVDALGGVPVCLDEPFTPREVGLRLPPGRHLLKPGEALDFVRARYGVDDGSDLSRIERQKDFMTAMVQRARSLNVFLRPDRALRFAAAATKSLEVDQDLDVRGLALSVRGIDPADVLFTTVPLDPDPGPRFSPGGDLAGRVKWDDAAAAQLFADFESDRLPGRAPPAVPPSAETPAPAAPPPAAPDAAASPPATRTAADSPCT